MPTKRTPLEHDGLLEADWHALQSEEVLKHLEVQAG